METETINNFDKGRLEGEEVLRRAMDYQVVPNYGFGFTVSSYTHPNIDPKIANLINRKDGDFWMVSQQTMTTEFIDAKGGNWISERSLNGIREGAFIAFNMHHQSTPFIIRANIEFKSFLRKHLDKSTRISGGLGYSVMFKDLPSDMTYLDFDVRKFIEIRLQVMIENGKMKP
jgi:hypothetical protein